MGSSMDESLKTLAESGKSRFHLGSNGFGAGLLPLGRLSYGMRHISSKA
jgi:hypothetical protein